MKNPEEEEKLNERVDEDRARETASVYKSTTIELKETETGVLDKMKKILHLGNSLDVMAVVGADRLKKQDLFKRAETLNEKKIHEMTEEAALLEHTDRNEIELKTMQKNRSLSTAMRLVISDCVEEIVETGDTNILVAVKGNRNKKAIVTYHDFGLNYASNFQAFFNYPEMKELLENFCVYHLNAPGQHDGATTFAENYEYPTMDELAAQLNYVLAHFNIKSFIGFGVGVGANILVRYAFHYPDKVNCLCLINCVSTSASWIEWGYQKLNSRNLKAKGMTQSVIDYLMWHHFGKDTDSRNPDLYHTYKNFFERHVNHHNLSLFIDSWVKRSELKLVRELDPVKRKSADTLQVSVLNITGALSPHVDDTVTLNGKLNPEKCSWMKISDCGMPLEEQPAKVLEAFQLFLQGSGYAPQAGRRRSSSIAAATVTPNTAAVVASSLPNCQPSASNVSKMH